MRERAPHLPEPIHAPYPSVYGLLVALGMAPDPVLPTLRAPSADIVAKQISKVAGKDVP